MTTVSTKQELISAIERRETQIIATGEIAASIRKKVKVKKGAVSSNFASADFRKIKTYNFQKS